MTRLFDGRPICGSCGDSPPERRTTIVAGTDPRFDGWGLRALTPHEYEQRARAAGWHMATGTTIGGRHYDDALCPTCAKPDRDTVRLCRDLQRGLFTGDEDGAT